MNINVIYGAGAADGAAPAGFYTAVNYVVDYLDQLFTNNVTINLNISYGSILDPYTGTYSTLSSGDLGESYDNGETAQSYTAVKDLLQADNTPGAGTLPNAPPASGTFYMGSAEAKALGIDGPSTALDGAVGVSASAAWDFTPNSTPASNQYYLVGVLEHEITEAMGRVSFVDGYGDYGVADLYRFSSPGVRSDSPGGHGSTAYFSIDDGNTDLGSWNNQLSNGDLADWYPHGPAPGGNDAFNDYSTPGVINALSSADITLMEALGWTTANSASSTGTSVAATTDDNTSSVSTGHSVTISLTAPNSLIVSGSPTLQLSDGEVAYYTGGSGTETLAFTYVPLSTDNSSDLQVTGLNLPAGSAVSGLSGNVTGDLGLTINSGTTAATVAEQINGLYVGLYGVAATEPGIQYWIEALAAHDPAVTTQNATILPISEADAAFLGEQFVFTQSSYFNSQYGNDTDGQFVAALYQNLTNSSGSPAGVQYWVGLLQTAEAANGGNVLAARAGIAGEFVHDVMSNNLSVGATALGLTSAEYSALVAGQQADLNKNAVSLFYATETGTNAGSLLNYTSESQAAFSAAQTAVSSVTSDNSTVTVELTGIVNAVTNHELSLV